MQKVYLLLRNNRQSGPFSIDELWQQQLRPTDMIWVEGKSTAWAYLTEIELLPTASNEERKAISSKDEIEKRAEELRLQALAYHPPRHKTALIREWPVDETGEVEEKNKEIELVDHRKDKKSIIGELMMTVLIIGLFAGGIYGSRTLFQSKRSQTVRTDKMESQDQHAAAQPRKPILVLQPAPSADHSVIADSAAVPEKQPLLALTRKKEQKKDSLHLKPVHTVSIASTDDTAASLVTSPGTNDASQTKTNDSQAVSRPALTVTEQPEKKKGLGAAIKGLFRKKKKDATTQTPDSTLGN